MLNGENVYYVSEFFVDQKKNPLLFDISNDIIFDKSVPVILITVNESPILEMIIELTYGTFVLLT